MKRLEVSRIEDDSLATHAVLGDEERVVLLGRVGNNVVDTRLCRRIGTKGQTRKIVEHGKADGKHTSST